MIEHFKDELRTDRITLKRHVFSVDLAKTIFSVVDSNRDHLSPWFIWMNNTSKVEDTVKFLLDSEREFKAGNKIEYGIYFEDEFVGGIGIFNIDKFKKSAELGYWLSSDFTRKGIMSEAVALVERELFLVWGLNRIQIKCDVQNVASGGVAKKCGFVFEGTLREDDFSKFYDSFRSTHVFSKLKSDFDKNN